jgi:hypothetical protein
VSIYASIEGIGDHGDPEHLGAPWLYQGSHHLPSEDDPRAGAIGLALIPSHITRDRRDDQPEDGTPYPWLRLSLDIRTWTEEPAVVLDRAQVEFLRDRFTAFLDQTEPR